MRITCTLHVVAALIVSLGLSCCSVYTVVQLCSLEMSSSCRSAVVFIRNCVLNCIKTNMWLWKAGRKQCLPRNTIHLQAELCRDCIPVYLQMNCRYLQLICSCLQFFYRYLRIFADTCERIANAQLVLYGGPDAHRNGQFCMGFAMGSSPDECKGGCSQKGGGRRRCNFLPNYFGHLSLFNGLVDEISNC